MLYNGRRTTMGGTGSGGGGLTQEEIEDFLGTSTLVAGTNVTITYDDGANTITIAAAGASGAPSDATYVTLSTNGTLSAERVLQGTSPVTVTDNTTTVDVSVNAATTSAAGIAELATAAETTTGTDTGRVVTPDGLAGSTYGTRFMVFELCDDDTLLAANDYRIIPIPAELVGYRAVSAVAMCTTPSASGDPTFDVLLGSNASATTAYAFTTLLDTPGTNGYIAIDATEYSSADDAATWSFLTTTFAAGDCIKCNCQSAGDGAVKGARLVLGVRLP